MFEKIRQLLPKGNNKPEFFEVNFRDDDGKNCDMILDKSSRVVKVYPGSEPNACNQAVKAFRENISDTGKITMANPSATVSKPVGLTNSKPVKEKQDDAAWEERLKEEG
jgi:peroxiredoxin